jgi:Pyridine nucleotide-disulphide oxidoreductase
LLLTGHNGELEWLAAEVSTRQPSWPAVISEAGMGTPVLFLVDEDRPALEALEALAADLGRRFGADYQILAEPSPMAALTRLGHLGAQSQPVALLLAAQRIAEMSGVEFLVAAHELHPAAKRVLLVPRGDYSAAHPAVQAMTVGQIDYHLFTPWQPAERWLYPALSNFLADWSKTAEPSFAAIRVVGRQWEPGSHQLVLEPEVFGGQAGTSSLIRNYPGFPHGISGDDLAFRTFEQAWLFGASFVFADAATALAADGPQRRLSLPGGRQVAARTVILAPGVSWRRLGVPSLEALAGAGVFYGAAGSEARAMEGREVFVTGAGNSAGQAAIHLAGYAASVTMLVRRGSLAATLSDYLIQKIQATPTSRSGCTPRRSAGRAPGGWKDSPSTTTAAGAPRPSPRRPCSC